MSAPQLKEQEVVCTECFSIFTANPKKGWGGFAKFNCPSCNKNITYPLLFGARFVWGLIFIAGILRLIILVVGIVSGESAISISILLFIPILMFVLSIFILVKDSKIQKKIGAAKGKAEENTTTSNVEYICSECGADVTLEDKICPKCGVDVSEIEENKK